jgi:PAS domain S-box-containing protein
LESNEFCLWIVSSSELLTMQEASNALQEVLPDLHRYMAEKSIELIGHDWFLNGGSFDFRRVANRFKEKSDEALSRGYVGMRVNGSPAWLETNNPKELRTFEAEVDQLFRHERIIASCTYPIGSSRADFLMDVARNHKFAIARRHGDWDIVETPELIQAKAEIDRLNAELEQKVIERTKKLEATTARLRAEIEERKETEEALRQSEERFAAFMDNLPGYAWMKDLEGRYVYINETFRQLRNAVGKTDADLWPEIASTYRANDNQVIQTKNALQTIEPFPRDPEQGCQIVSKFPILDQDGAVVMVGGASVDITERIEAEAALRESEAKLRQAQHLADIGYWERDLIADRITWSEETGRILGLESFSGVPNQAQLYEFIHPDDRRHHEQVFNEALQDSRLFDVEVRFVRPDGGIRFVHIRDEIVRDEAGKPIRMFGAVQDITHLKQAEEAVRRSEEHLRLVIDTIPVMAWSVRPDGVVDFLNQRWLDYAGLSLGEYVKDPTGPIHPEDIPRVIEKRLAQKASGEGYEDEMRLRAASGEYRWFLVRTEPLRDEQGNLVKWYGSSTDIEDRKQAEEKLKATTEQLRALSARLQSAREEEGSRIAREIHDQLGAALSSLRWDLEGIAETISESADQSRLLELRKKMEAIMGLTDTTLNTVRRIASELRPIGLDALGLSEAIEMQAQQFQERTGIRIQCDCTLENVDLSQEQSTAAFRIFQEASTNILRHAQATTVNIQMKKEDGEFILTIRDNGRGITPDEKSGQRTLGLLGMRERAHLVGGKIDITGLAGKGTVVTVRIPISG